MGKVSFFGQTVNLIGPLVLGPCPYDDIFIYWTVNFLMLTLLDRHALGLRLVVWFFVGPSVYKSWSI